MRIRALCFMLTICALAASPVAAEIAAPHGITFDDFLALGRIGAFEISPDSRWIAFEATWFDKKANSSNTDIYLVPVMGGEPTAFARSDGDDSSPAWSPDGKLLAFSSDRDGESQIWVIPVDGGEARKVTDVPTGASSPLWSPDGKWIAFTSSVYPDCPDMDCNRKKVDEAKNSKVKARYVDELLFRHWNSWREGRWSHLFLTDPEGKQTIEINTGRTDCPPLALGGERDYDFSPDGGELCFVMNPDAFKASSTNNDIFMRPVAGGEAVNITAANRSNDVDPRYSPDGRFIAYRAQLRPGFEADRIRLMLYDRASRTVANLTESFDYSIDNFVWSRDGKALIFTTEERGRKAIGRVSIKGNDAALIIRDAWNTSVRATPDGRHLVFARQSATHPVDLWRAGVKGSNVTQLTDINKEILAGLVMNPIEEFNFEGALGDKVQGFIVKPPFFDAAKKYPLLLLIHGGPQGCFGDDFHYRWNWQMFASGGYVVATVNFHGSTGFGQAFLDEISGDWGGAPYEDIMKGVDYVLANYPYVDKERMAAAGASYGGYMVNWIEGHTTRFRCLVSHAGVYNLESMYGATEELWFPEWEFKGTPWTNPEMYAKFSPHRYVANFKTPCLVVHGERDFRVPYGEGLQFFTALQRQGVPSRLLYFPDEYHFVTKPQNAELWWKTLHEWFAEYLKK